MNESNQKLDQLLEYISNKPTSELIDYFSVGKNIKIDPQLFQIISFFIGTLPNQLDNDRSKIAEIFAITAFFLKHRDLNRETQISENEKSEFIALYRLACDALKKDGNIEQICQDLIQYLKASQQEIEAAEFVKKLPSLKSKPPKKHTMPNCYLANELQQGKIIDAGKLLLPVFGEGKNAPRKGGDVIRTSVMVDFQQSDDVNISGNYTEYDRQVQDAVCSLWLYGDQRHVFTPAMLYRAMTHMTETEKPTPQQIEAVIQSIEKQRRIYAKVDASTEFERRSIKDADGNPIFFKVGDFLLSLKDIEVTAGGKTVNAYLINSEPLLLTYSRYTKQLLTVPSSWLDIKRMTKEGKISSRSLANTESRITIKGYLNRRLEIMKHDDQVATENYSHYLSRKSKKPELPEKTLAKCHKLSNRILFSTLFHDTGQESTDRNIKKNNRDYALDCLRFWQAIGRIKNFTILTGEKGKIIGVDIEM